MKKEENREGGGSYIFLGFPGGNGSKRLWEDHFRISCLFPAI